MRSPTTSICAVFRCNSSQRGFGSLQVILHRFSALSRHHDIRLHEGPDRRLFWTNDICIPEPQSVALGLAWKRIAAEMEVGGGSLYRVALDGSKIREKVF
jgi:hypothetical protein